MGRRGAHHRGVGVRRAAFRVLALVLVAGVIAARGAWHTPGERVYTVAEVLDGIYNRPDMRAGRTVLVRGVAMAVGRMNPFGTWEEAVCDDPRRCIEQGVVNHLELGADPALVAQTQPSSVLPIDFGQGRNGLVLRVRRTLAANPVDPLTFFRALPGIGHLIPSIGTTGTVRRGATLIYRIRILPPSACTPVQAVPSGSVCDDAEALART